MARTHEGWGKARDLRYFFMQHKDEKYSELKNYFHTVEISREKHGYWVLYEDDKGNFYDEYYGD